MITSVKQDMPNKLAGCFPVSHLYNDMKEIEAHFKPPDVLTENPGVLGKTLTSP